MGKRPPVRKLPPRLPCIVHALCGSVITGARRAPASCFPPATADLCASGAQELDHHTGHAGNHRLSEQVRPIPCLPQASHACHQSHPRKRLISPPVCKLIAHWAAVILSFLHLCEYSSSSHSFGADDTERHCVHRRADSVRERGAHSQHCAALEHHGSLSRWQVDKRQPEGIRTVSTTCGLELHATPVHQHDELSQAVPMQHTPSL